MTTTLQDITLQSLDGVIEATNDNGHLVAPILFLDRAPVPEDMQGRDRVLVFVDGDESSILTPAAIILNEENNFFQSLSIETSLHWSIRNIDNEKIVIESSSGQMEGVGHARIDVSKIAALTAQGTHTCTFDILFTDAVDTVTTIPVTMVINVPLKVNDKKVNETLTINLTSANNYTEFLTIIRDREWFLENVDESVISVSPKEGNGSNLPEYKSILTVTKSPLLAKTTASTSFQVVSLFQRINVKITITLSITGEFVDPLDGEEGVTGTDNLYIYI
jgi:hypothetical protein